MIIQNPLLTGSLNYNGADLSNVTSSNANSASVSLILTAVSSSNQQLSASYIALSGSYNVFSGSASTRITTVSASQQDISSSLLQVSASYIALSGSYNTFSGSASTRVTQIENTYATTGSNSFRADQSITGSLVVSSTITAQTLVVQTVTSSIVYSSGSNLFGSALGDRQTFTGSVNITGSLALAGNITSNGTAVVLGSGTSSYLPKFTGASTIGNSLLTDNGTNIGLGVANPTAGRLQINVSDTTTAAHLQIVDGTTTLANSFVTNFRNANDGDGRYSLSRWQVQNAVGNDQNGFIGVQSVTGAGAYTPNIVFGQRTGVSTYATRMTLDASGNLGLGVTPSGWISTAKAFQLGNTAALYAPSSEAILSNNVFVDSTDNNKYITTNFASQYRQVNGQHIFYSADSGTAGNTISFGSAKLTIASTGAATFSSSITAGGNLNLQAGATRNINFYDSSNTNINAQIQYDQLTSNTGQLFFGTNNAGTFATRLTITSGGNVGIGITNPGAKLQVKTSTSAGATDAFYIENTSLALFGVRDDGLIYMKGNVGIGTSSPLGKLDISTGGNRNVVISNDSTDTGYNIVSLNGSRTKGAYAGIAGGGTGDNSLYLNSGVDIVFQNGASFTQRMRTVNEFTLAGGAGGSGGPTQVIGTTSMCGILFVSIGTQNCAAIFIINAASAPVLVSQTSVETRFSNTYNSLNTANVYVSGTNIELQNNIQATRAFYCQFFGKLS